MTRLLTLVLLILPFQLMAHETETHYDRIHLSASAQQQIENDTIIATLYAEEEGSNVAQLANTVNKKINWAVDAVKKHSDIKLQTSAYSTHPVYHKSKINRWRVRQTVRLESQNMTKVSELLGQLQSKLALQGMHFAVSPELKNRTDDALITDALTAFEKRAEIVVKQLARSAYKIVSINIATSGGVRPHRQFARTAMLAEAMDAPAVEAGEQTLQVTVSGHIELE